MLEGEREVKEEGIAHTESGSAKFVAAEANFLAIAEFRRQTRGLRASVH
jgi:hypothetical protein